MFHDLMDSIGFVTSFDKVGEAMQKELARQKKSRTDC